MNKQIANFGRKLSAADMKKTTGGIRVGTGSSLRCGPPPVPCDVLYDGNCCGCCAGSIGDNCRYFASLDPACWSV